MEGADLYSIHYRLSALFFRSVLIADEDGQPTFKDDCLPEDVNTILKSMVCSLLSTIILWRRQEVLATSVLLASLFLSSGLSSI